MFEQDYIIRMIKEMVRAILKLLFNIDTANPTEELLEENQQKDMFNELTDLINKGEINQAENKLYSILESGDKEDFKIAVLFYMYLNNLDDDYLAQHDYSREEIKEGLRDIMSRCGITGLDQLFED